MKKPQPTQTVEVKLGSAVLSEVDVHFFNRFKVEREGQFRFIYLGSVLSGEVMDSHVIAIAEHDIQNCYSNSKQYIAALGSVSLESSKDWSKPVTNKRVLTANILNLSHAGSVAEVHFSNFLIHDYANFSRGLKRAGELTTKNLLIARSDIALHKQFLGHLFNGLND